MIQNLVEENGGIVALTFGPKTDYLVLGDKENKSSGKERDAGYYNVKTITEDEFFDMMIPKHILRWQELLKGK